MENKEIPKPPKFVGGSGAFARAYSRCERQSNSLSCGESHAANVTNATIIVKLLRSATMAIAQTTNGSSAEQFLSSGVTKYNSGDKQGALAEYNQAIQLNPNYALAYVNRGVVRSAVGDRQGAIADLDLAISFA